MPFEILRQPDRDTLLASCALMSESLGFTFGVRGLTEEAFVESEGAANFRVIVDASPAPRRRVAGALTFQRAGLFMGGRSVKMAGIRCVGVAPEARGRGVLRALLSDTLAELRAEGVPLSALYPSSPRVYRAFGYEHAGMNVVRRLPLVELPDPGPAPLTIEPVSTDEIPSLHDVYARVAAAHNGWVDRSAWWWPRVLVRPYAVNKPRLYRFVRDDRVEGYVALQQVLGDGPARLHVAELVVETGDAARCALALLHAHRSIFSVASWHSGAIDLLSLFVDVPVGDVEPVGMPLPHPINPWMLRLLDPKAAIEGRGFSPAVDAELHLYVLDRTLPANSGPLRLRIRDGRAEAERAGHGSLRLDVRALSALYTGHLGVHALSLAGLLEGGDARERASLDGVFAGPPAWMWDAF